MKKSLVVAIALLAAVAVAMPAFAVDFKTGGMFRIRWQSNDNITDGLDDADDNNNWFDQRLRMYFTFVGSENLQVVTNWEADTLWGHESAGAGRHGGGDIGADATNLEMKNVYMDFNLPNTPLNFRMGVQGYSDPLGGWIFSDDFSGVTVRTQFEPVALMLGYAAGKNDDPTDESENIDDFIIQLTYANGPFSGALVGFYQMARDNFGSTPFDGTAGFTVPAVESNDLFDLGVNLAYKGESFDATINFVKNFGSYDIVGGGSGDYKGWMVEAKANFAVQNFVFTLGGFYTSGDDDDDYDADYFAYPVGRSYYWSEILGLGTLDVSVDGADALGSTGQGAYYAADRPTNLWTIMAGVAWQALEDTRLTFNYYYINTSEDVVANTDGTEDDSVGHEVNFYVDQKVVDGLNLRLVGAYLFADDAYKTNDDDDDAYEVGAQLLWSF